LDAVLLHEAERILRKHDPGEFATSLAAFPERIEYVRQVEDQEAWKAGYPSLESFYQANEGKHPLIRVYGEYRRRIETEQPLKRKDIALPPLEKLEMLRQELETNRPSGEPNA
jgi:hypothetical protein